MAASGVTTHALRPYLAAFTARFLLMLQYRAAALAGFATQCWWGAIKVMVYAAFYAAAPAAAAQAPITLSQAITYTWLSQAFLALLPWFVDPEIGQSVRTGAVAYDRLRPVDTYAYWYARSAGWMTARAAPRAALMFAAAGIALPLLGLADWAWLPPPSLEAAALFTLSMVLVVLLSSALIMLINLTAAASLDARGANAVMMPVVTVFSGSLLPLALYPDWMHTFLLAQPFAGLVDIPFRIYSGNLAGSAAWTGIALQAFWTLAFVLLGRLAMEKVMDRLQVQGG
ncbi:MAG: ABC transporter permease [Phenylobacterium sp.]|uniref:ABC transporter permease n=1 Tax=Phenylobacterium sp. TaxID=1871053 RepID=UPI00391C0CD8